MVDYQSFICSLANFAVYRYTTNSQRDQLSVGLIAKLIEHYIGSIEVMESMN